MNYLAQINNVDGVATLQGLEGVFSSVVGILLGLGGIILFLMLISGGFRYLTAGANAKAAEAARNTITVAIAGLILVASAYLILRFIADFTGADILEFTIFR